MLDEACQRKVQNTEAGHGVRSAIERAAGEIRRGAGVVLHDAAMLRALGFARVCLLTNNPAKVVGLSGCGIEVVERFPHAFPANGHNERYLHTKASRAGHLL